MADETMDLSELLRRRAQTYGMLARLYRVEVDADTLEELRGMRFPVNTGNALVDSGYRGLFNYLKTSWHDSLTELAIDYARCFIGHGVNGYSAAYPYESVYTSERRLMMQEARAEVLAIFRQNGFKRDKWNEGEDHIALELEFMQRMSMRAADFIDDQDEEKAIENLQVQLDFAHDHLENWVPMLVADMRQFAQTSFYLGLADLTIGFIQEDITLIEELLE